MNVVRSAVPFAFVVVSSLAACNSVLGNDPGILGDDAAAPDAAMIAVDASMHVDAFVPLDAAPDVAPDAAEIPDSGPSCGTGQKLCFGACVAINDPLYGCGLTVCAPCALTHAITTCAAGACAVASCAAGYADCDSKAATGCETDLSQAAHCGTCNAVCPPADPICAPSGTTFGCATGCSAQAPTLCTDQCVDTTSNETHCGGCNTVCPTPSNGTASCAQSQCAFTCATGYHACGNTCANSGDTASCGASCSPCPAPQHATAGCNGTSCTFACRNGFADCDGNAANGCEVTLANDDANCGACNHACTGASTCMSGTCVFPPDASVPDASTPDASAPDASTPDASIDAANGD